MRALLMVAGLEFRRLWSSAMPYLTGAVFVGLSGYFFCMVLFSSHHADVMPGVASSMLFFLVVIIPFLTMRIFVEDRMLGTDVLLQLSSLRIYHLVLGKYFSILGTVLLFILATLPLPLFLIVMGDPDWGLLLGSYLSLVLFSAAVSAIGIWASSVSRHYVVSALLAFGVLMLFWLSGAMAGIFYGPVGRYCEKLSMPNHVVLLQQGIVTSDDLSYFLVLTMFFLVCTCLSVLFRREAA
jgi:ABC-2 type transport system permease protein